MIRGLYTGASGMVVQMHHLDAVANNLANVDLSGYKRDTPVDKAFPEILLRRMNDDGVFKFPLGSVDTTPIVGRLGTGVELNEVYTVFEQGPLKQTENPFDLALEGAGFLSIATEAGERYTRNGSFHLNDEGWLVTKHGEPVLGENGPLQLKKNNFVIDQDGVVWQNGALAGDPRELVSLEQNEWESMERVDRLRLVDFEHPRHLKKVGNSFWEATEESGPASIPFQERPKVRQGFLEGANVNVVTEMVQMIEVNRSYEANQKVIQTHDALLGRLVNDVIRA
ncbi:MAG: flagellar basal-body rod protein FlgF [Spirochaetes bacterium GWB1_66_5]|nr:MAG: flagellar basal-body rod protein FlgF [Spirochaetes bacterium GWB1_66_5]